MEFGHWYFEYVPKQVLHQTTKESLSDERYGTLTQRLMSCLIEENVIGFSRDKLPIVVPQRQTVSSSSAASIEQRIRRELEELGVMQSPAQKVIIIETLLLSETLLVCIRCTVLVYSKSMEADFSIVQCIFYACSFRIFEIRRRIKTMKYFLNFVGASPS